MVATRLNVQSPAPLPRKRILLVHTGGTLGGIFDDDVAPHQVGEVGGVGQDSGGTPEVHAFLQELRAHCREIFDLADLSVRVLFQADSSNLGTDDWRAIGDVIVSSWGSFDAFVIVHGTDTLAYCSSFLSMTMGTVAKPIVVTGSQRPLRELRSDARMNLIDAVQLASLSFPGVFVAFDSNVYLGSRVAKTSNLELGAFQSPNFPALGHFGVEIELNTDLIGDVPKDHGEPRFDPRADSGILAVSIVPGARVSAALREAMVRDARGLVIEGFGLGHGPTRMVDWLELCEAAYSRRLPVVMTSPCRRGRVDMDLYPVGRAFRERGVVSGSDMTKECATVKLMLLLGRRVAFAERHVFMAHPLARETSAALPEGVLI